MRSESFTSSHPLSCVCMKDEVYMCFMQERHLRRRISISPTAGPSIETRTWERKRILRSNLARKRRGSTLQSHRVQGCRSRMPTPAATPMQQKLSCHMVTWSGKWPQCYVSWGVEANRGLSAHAFNWDAGS
jgi:hypothetical protein